MVAGSGTTLAATTASSTATSLSAFGKKGSGTEFTNAGNSSLASSSVAENRSGSLAATTVAPVGTPNNLLPATGGVVADSTATQQPEYARNGATRPAADSLNTKGTAAVRSATADSAALKAGLLHRLGFWTDLAAVSRQITLSGSPDLQFGAATLPGNFSQTRFNAGIGTDYLFFDSRYISLLGGLGLRFVQNRFSLQSTQVQPGVKIVRPDSNTVLYTENTAQTDLDISRSVLWLQAGLELRVKWGKHLFISGLAAPNWALAESGSADARRLLNPVVPTCLLRPALGMRFGPWQVAAGPEFWLPLQKTSPAPVTLKNTGFALRIGYRLK